MRVLLEEGGLRLDAALALCVEGLTRSQAQRLMESGAVTLNGRLVGKSERTVAGWELEVEIPEPVPTCAVAQAMDLDIGYEDEDLIVINKPKGLVVHPAAGHWDGTLVNGLLHHCAGSLSGVGGKLRPGIVHRIDKDTSGLIIVAKNDFAHQALAAQLESHTLQRVYACVCVGGFREDAGTIDAPIGRHNQDRKKMAVTQQGGRDAVTHWQVLERFVRHTLAQCRLETGRTHQIRVHLASQGHPILGDMVYGRKKPELGLDSQCLHAKELTFIHPRSGEAVTVTAPLPDYFNRVLDRLRAMT